MRTTKSEGLRRDWSLDSMVGPELWDMVPLGRPEARDYEIGFAIMSRIPGQLELPFFSKVTLRSAVEDAERVRLPGDAHKRSKSPRAVDRGRVAVWDVKRWSVDGGVSDDAGRVSKVARSRVGGRGGFRFAQPLRGATLAGMTPFVLQPSSGTPIYRQIAQQTARLIAGGHLGAGERLPSVRAVAADQGVNAMSVSKAYAVLERDDLVVRSVGRSLIVSSDTVYGDCNETP